MYCPIRQHGGAVFSDVASQRNLWRCMFFPCLCNWDTPSCLSIIRFSVVLSQGTNQHDVQELNRILFSALEHSLVDTTGSTFIHQLYHGTIVNSIVCKECGNVSQRQVCECLQGFSASLSLCLSACLLNTGGNTFLSLAQ